MRTICLALVGAAAAVSASLPAAALDQAPGFDVPPGDVFAPPADDDGRLRAPNAITITRRAAGDVVLIAHDRTTAETRYRLERRDLPGEWVLPDGNWTTVGSVAAQDDWFEMRDTAIGGDRAACWRIWAEDDAGNRHPSAERCAHTLEAREDTPQFSGRPGPVFRADLTLRTGTVDGAGTDDSVSVRLNANGLHIVPNGHQMWLDYPRDDFEAGAEESYSLLLERVGSFSDITRIEIAKTGDDGWCLAGLDLHVNTVLVYSTDLDDGQNGCVWVGDAQDPLVVDFATLRAAETWREAVFPSLLEPLEEETVEGGELRHWRVRTEVLGLDGEGLSGRLAGTLGHAFHGTATYWGRFEGSGEGLRLTPVSSGAILVDVAAKRDVTLFPDPDVHFSAYFTLAAGCVSGDFLSLAFALVPIGGASVPPSGFERMLDVTLLKRGRADATLRRPTLRVTGDGGVEIGFAIFFPDPQPYSRPIHGDGCGDVPVVAAAPAAATARVEMPPPDRGAGYGRDRAPVAGDAYK